jgi:murein DD-endopeptidase MepM/ murein hydrolase activator NlpD
VVLSGIGGAGTPTTGATQPIVEVIVTGDGRARTTTRFTNTGVGSRLRYVEHSVRSEQGEELLAIVQADAVTGLRVTTTLSASSEVRAARVLTTVHNDGDQPVVLEAVSSFAFGALINPGESTKDLVLHSGTGEQLAENRWTARPLWSQTALADFNPAFTKQPGRGSFEAVSTSTWTTGRALPTAVLENSVTGRSIAWQIEHNGAWRWEIDNVREGEDSVAVILLGPEDLDHHWSEELAPGESFTSVPVSVSVATDAQGYYKARGFRSRGHLGEDWDGIRGGDTDLGDPIYSIGDGLVVFARDCHMGWGNVMIIRHSYREGGVVKNIDALYGHLNRMLVHRGQAVRRGQQIATMGTAHGLYDAHLHLEIRKNIEIGMSRTAFARDSSNYYDPTQFIVAHRHLSTGGGTYRVAMNTFVRDAQINFDKARNYSHSRSGGGTSESAAALKKAIASER